MANIDNVGDKRQTRCDMGFVGIQIPLLRVVVGGQLPNVGQNIGNFRVLAHTRRESGIIG
jgi:hypothetical protein